MPLQKNTDRVLINIFYTYKDVGWWQITRSGPVMLPWLRLPLPERPSLRYRLRPSVHDVQLSHGRRTRCIKLLGASGMFPYSPSIQCCRHQPKTHPPPAHSLTEHQAILSLEKSAELCLVHAIYCGWWLLLWFRYRQHWSYHGHATIRASILQ